MNDLPREELLNKTGSIYKLVILAARRAIDLGGGAARLVDAPVDAKISTVALKEILAGKIKYKVKGEK